jgi:S1-C subfamily serine protease
MHDFDALDCLTGLLIGFLCSVLLFGCASLPHGRTVEEQELSAAKLHVSCGPPGTDQTDRMLHGSAVIVSELRALTAAHVVGCTVNGAALELADGRMVQVEIEAVSTQLDVARLVAKEPLGAPPLTVARVLEGDVVCVTSRSPAMARHCGEVVKAEENGGLLEIVHRATTVSGNSGSGLYDRRGRLVGIVTRKVNIVPGGGVASIVRRWFIEPR